MVDYSADALGKSVLIGEAGYAGRLCRGEKPGRMRRGDGMPLLQLDWDLEIPGNAIQAQIVLQSYRDNIAKLIDSSKAAVKMRCAERQANAAIKTAQICPVQHINCQPRR